MSTKAVMPRDKRANLKFNEKLKRWDYRVRLVKPDGAVFTRAGSAVTESAAREKRNAAYKEFNGDLGVGRDHQKRKQAEAVDDLSTWTKRVLPVIEQDCAPTTFEAYTHSLENHVLPALGSLALEEVRSLVVTEHLQKLSRDVSPGVASQARSALSRVMEMAALDERIASNPVKSVRVGSRERRQDRMVRAQSGDTGKRWLTMAEGSLLLERTRDTETYMPILLGLWFGLRSGEALGLLWSAVDIIAKVIRVRQQAVSVKGAARMIVPPKSAAGIRDIPIPDAIIEQLTLAKARAKELGQEWVCVDESGEPFHPKHVSRLVKRAVTLAGFDGSDGAEVPTSHDFRSSYLTWLANYANNGAGVKPHVLMAIAGHSSIDMAMRFYVKAGVEDLVSAVNTLAL